MTTQNKRQFTRIHFTRKVRLQFDGTDYEFCQIKDLSLTGMFVFGSFKQKVGDTFIVNLCQTGASTKLAMNATAKVVWINDYGLAIQFKSMAFDSYMFLQTTLLYEAENPLFIGLELPEKRPFEIIEAASETPKETDNFQDFSFVYEHVGGK